MVLFLYSNRVNIDLCGTCATLEKGSFVLAVYIYLLEIARTEEEEEEEEEEESVTVIKVFFFS